MGYYIDRDGHSIWLADSDGVGWFVLFIIIALPFFVFGIIVLSLAAWITEHFLAASGIFLLVNATVSLFMSMKRKTARELIMDLVANFMLLQTVFFTAVLYGIPYIINKESWWDVFELVITVGFNLGIIILIKAINRLHNKAWINLITSFLFGMIYILVMNRLLKNITAANELMILYNFSNEWIFNLFFGLFFV